MSAPPSVTASVAEPNDPLPPRPSITGCVESRELKAYVLALEAQRQANRRAALAALGASDVRRRGAFADPRGPEQLDVAFEAEGRRFAVAAQLAPHFEPQAALAKQGSVLRRITEHPHAEAVAVLACGVQHCPERVNSIAVAARALVVELLPGETWGSPLELAYDYSWARVAYDRVEPCPPPPDATP